MIIHLCFFYSQTRSFQLLIISYPSKVSECQKNKNMLDITIERLKAIASTISVASNYQYIHFLEHSVSFSNNVLILEQSTTVTLLCVLISVLIQDVTHSKDVQVGISPCDYYIYNLDLLYNIANALKQGCNNMTLVASQARYKACQYGYITVNKYDELYDFIEKPFFPPKSSARTFRHTGMFVCKKNFFYYKSKNFSQRLLTKVEH